jgi:hypothetical protein
MQEYKRRQFRGHPPSLAEKFPSFAGFRGVLASRRSSAERVGGDALTPGPARPDMSESPGGPEQYAVPGEWRLFVVQNGGGS